MICRLDFICRVQLQVKTYSDSRPRWMVSPPLCYLCRLWSACPNMRLCFHANWKFDMQRCHPVCNFIHFIKTLFFAAHSGLHNYRVYLRNVWWLVCRMRFATHVIYYRKLCKGQGPINDVILLIKLVQLARSCPFVFLSVFASVTAVDCDETTTTVNLKKYCVDIIQIWNAYCSIKFGD